MQAAVSPEWLFEQIELNRPISLIDCRFDLMNPDSGRKLYNENHLPRSVYFGLDQDLSGGKLVHGGRHPLPDMIEFKKKVEEAGISNDQPVVVYDDGEGAFAARAWWLLTYAGHKQVYMLNGGYSEWISRHLPVTNVVRDQQKGRFQLDLQDHLVADTAEIENIVSGKQSALLIDSRNYSRYLGDHEPIDRVPGHIPGAINSEWINSFENGWLLDEEMQAKRFSEWDKNQPLIVYCGSGVTACPNFIALKQAGFTNVKLYPGSYSDWVSYDHHEIELGDSTHMKKTRK
ncbi:sulfurtransferase [Jeotgalibacillus salarius]|uniref:Sulfurtransferase n=1 Tax=Jeotgalibacillus salarius TaxID=546023 RepID=A0A4Y8LQ26_9BACL|nr:sulfurtransferase [Jeotgalibacillus salarius]TFE03037.1 sulfurtransferase [Jeotgalibacillus salarius]